MDVIKRRSYWSQVGPNPMTGVLVRGGKFGDRHREEVGTGEDAVGNHTDTQGRGPCDNGGRDGSGEAAWEAGVSTAPCSRCRD